MTENTGEPGDEPLTDREREIVRLLAMGHDNRTIATQLNLSEKTVGNRLVEIFQKLQVTNRTQAALVAIRRGLISLGTRSENDGGAG